jgi:hypothetical protein
MKIKSFDIDTGLVSVYFGEVIDFINIRELDHIEIMPDKVDLYNIEYITKLHKTVAFYSSKLQFTKN